MSWSVYLRIGSLLEVWHEEMPSSVALLFGPEDFVTEGVPELESDAPSPSSAFRSTVGRCKRRLSALGYDWSLFLASYREGVSGRVTLAMAMGCLAVIDMDAAERLPALFEATSPEEDLAALGRVCMWQAREDSHREEGAILQELPGGGEERGYQQHFDMVLQWARDRPEAYDVLFAARAVEFIIWLRRQSPDFGWLFFVRAILEAFQDDEFIEFDIAGRIRQFIEDGREVEPNDFASAYVQGSIEALADDARLIGRLYAVLADLEKKVGRNYWGARAAGLLERLLMGEGTAQVRGRLLEDLLESLVRMDPQLPVVEKNLLNETEEIDLVLQNQLQSPFWAAMQSPLLFIECKNWKTVVGAPEARIFESKIRERGNLCRVGIFVSMAGFSDPCLQILRRVQSQGLIIFAVTGQDLRQMVGERVSLTEWLASRGMRQIV
ncbi:hypothetical protein COCOR_03303 [Corallococcus coralloides DSM 2259]|uniref:Restriction endonuclease type IV Mrr domain-containing protein n=1 Tax=Corallococcus coralloides (strain ATCC 25202 / DSM 2259 / NBRC 100086 / M2) TaxID=1144275 RepID=H8MHT8_CORCM|nr:HEPN/Toprim-associated domain-containing protein [Corallococcus coralloides]AFE05146.1 hypothetical protein COCOR_03303 [Corallococcus coralloides DSM 2259]